MGDWSMQDDVAREARAAYYEDRPRTFADDPRVADATTEGARPGRPLPTLTHDERARRADELRERGTCSGCLARTYRDEECVCDDDGDAEDVRDLLDALG